VFWKFRQYSVRERRSIAAVQTLRDGLPAAANAERLGCGGLRAAFPEDLRLNITKKFAGYTAERILLFAPP